MPSDEKILTFHSERDDWLFATYNIDVEGIVLASDTQEDAWIASNLYVNL